MYTYKQINYEESFISICPSLTVCISVYTLYTEAFAFIYKNPTPLCDRHKKYLIRTQSKKKNFGSGFHSFSSTPKMDKLMKICKNRMEKKVQM